MVIVCQVSLRVLLLDGMQQAKPQPRLQSGSDSSSSGGSEDAITADGVPCVQ